MITVYKTHVQKQRQEQARAYTGLCDGVRPYSPEYPVKSWGPLHRQTGSRKNLTATGYWAERELRKTEQGVNGSVLVQQSGLQCNPAEGYTHCSALISQLGT